MLAALASLAGARLIPLEAPPVLTSPRWPRTHATPLPPLPAQMDPKFLRNQRFSKKWMGKGRESSE